MDAPSSWQQYRGNGETPGQAPVTRGEHGRYLADASLVIAVNTALAVEQPLLVTGEPGTGKTALAFSVASELGLGPVLEFHTRSDHRARDVLYIVDNLMRFYHAQVRDSRAQELGNYYHWQALGEAIRSPMRRVVLIDEIDKAPRDFPNDLLDEIDRMAFTVPELGLTYQAEVRPIVIITSNSERQLPDPFLRRCVYHNIEFPSGERLATILQERLGHLQLSEHLVSVAVQRFEELRMVPQLQKDPGLGELLAWVRVLVRAGIAPEQLRQAQLAALPFQGALIKNHDDLRTVARS